MSQQEKLVLGSGKKVKPISGPHQVSEPKVVPTQAQARVKTTRTPITTQVFTLAGVTHSKYPFEDLMVGQGVSLVPDPYGQTVKPEEGHPDATAVSVQDSHSIHIGYLKAAVAQVIFRALTSGAYECEAKVIDIKGGHPDKNGKALNWGVDVEAKFFTKAD